MLRCDAVRCGSVLRCVVVTRTWTELIGGISPALFAGYDRTPKHAVEQFVSLSVDYGLIFPLL